MIGESILELHETNTTDESIKSYEYDEYQPITGTQLNSAGQIKITIENQDQFLHLRNSYLLIGGNVLKVGDTRYADADLIALVINVLLYLFSSSNNLIPLSFRMRQCETFSLSQERSTVWRLGVTSAPEKPRWVLAGLQTNKSVNQENNAAIFDHCNLTNMQV